ncbi:hypothetical protein [Sporosarcina sp. P33]|uniref:hypothetical protein n=1 Tax=Sporosarcina sp. P33 TaxID=1930764 RepID=UPI0009C0E898|nr:hypothetical protein [Sporosarcina sp. P33]ARD47589.1 hypothetical protein SporoP33_04615 [Sporosarcina sp. P33]
MIKINLLYKSGGTQTMNVEETPENQKGLVEIIDIIDESFNENLHSVIRITEGDAVHIVRVDDLSCVSISETGESA